MLSCFLLHLPFSQSTNGGYFSLEAPDPPSNSQGLSTLFSSVTLAKRTAGQTKRPFVSAIQRSAYLSKAGQCKKTTRAFGAMNEGDTGCLPTHPERWQMSLNPGWQCLLFFRSARTSNQNMEQPASYMPLVRRASTQWPRWYISSAARRTHFLLFSRRAGCEKNCLPAAKIP